MGPGGRQGLALFPLRLEPESLARAAAGGVRAARLTGGSRRLAPLTRLLLPTDSLRTWFRLQGWIPSGLRSGRGGGGGHRRLLDPPSCGETKGSSPRLCLESHLRTWRRPRRVGGPSGRTPLPRGLGDSGVCPGDVCRARGENCGPSQSASKWRSPDLFSE